MNFKPKYHFKDVLGVFTVEGWLVPGSFTLDLKIYLSPEGKKDLLLDDVIQLRDKLNEIIEKHRELQGESNG